MPSDHGAELPIYVTTLAIKAWHWLNNPMLVEPALVDQRGLRLGLQRIRLWSDTSGFCDIEPQTLTVFYPFDETCAPILRKAEWQRSKDLQRVPATIEIGGKDIDPTIIIQDVRLDKTRLEEILQAAMSLRMSLCWPWQEDRRSITSDVGTVGFEVFDLSEPQARLRLAWSSDVPPGWAPIVEWHNKLVDWFEECFVENKA